MEYVVAYYYYARVINEWRSEFDHFLTPSFFFPGFSFFFFLFVRLENVVQYDAPIVLLRSLSWCLVDGWVAACLDSTLMDAQKRFL